MGRLTLVYVLLCLPAFCMSRTMTNRVDTTPAGCEWSQFVQEEPSDQSQEIDPRTLLSCQLRTIGNAESLLSNLSTHQTSRVSALRLSCSDVLFFESSLKESKGEFLGQLKKLRYLRIEYCKIRYVPSMVLSSLRDLRELSMRTHNTDWSAMTMEFHPESFRGLTELRKLDLADNNIWSLPTEIFCPLYSLQLLNLTRNRLQDVSQLGFSDWGEGPQAPGKSCNTGLETLDLSDNDISTLPDNGLSSLRSLHTLLLQDNSLNSLGDRAFVGLTSLQILNASCNSLVALPPELFQSSRDLAQIYLQNNSLSVLAPGLFEGLDRLQVLDLGRNELTSRWVNRDTFSGLVRLVVLNLARNQLSRIDAQVFRDLYSLQILSLDHNIIESIADDAFDQMKNLHALTLSSNRLTAVEARHFSGLYVLNQLFLDGNMIQSVNERSFENMTNLHDLSLNDNLLEDVPAGLGHLHFLKSLDLGKNRIRSVVNTSFDGLDQLYGLRLVDNLIVNITRDAFMALPSLQVLNLASNQISHVEQSAFGSNPTVRAIRLDGNKLEDISGAFTSLPGLVWLNVSDNKLRSFDYSHLPTSLEWLDMHQNHIRELGNYYGVRHLLKIKMLDASFNKLTAVREHSIPDSVETVFLNNNDIELVEAGTFLNKTSLEKVVLYGNKLRKIELASFGLTPVPEHQPLPVFYIGSNPFHCDCSMEWLLHANQLSGLRQYPRYPDLDTVTCTLAHSRDGQPRSLLDLTPGDFLCRYETHCFALCHCCDFDACDCEMTCPDRCTCYHDHAWSSNVVDCSNAGYENVPERIPMDATEIYLDGNDLGDLGSHAFIGKKKLRVLYLNNSNIESLHNRTFNGVGSLQVLHLENNKLRELRGYEFDRLEKLDELYLDHNEITVVGNDTFKTSQSLRILTLDANKIMNLPIPSTRAKLSLDGSMWSCDRCDYLMDTLTLLAQQGIDPAKFRCSSLTESLADAAKRCASTNTLIDVNKSSTVPAVQRTVLPGGGGLVPVLAAVIVAVIGVALLLALVFAFRQDVRLWAHSRYGIRLTSAGPPQDRERLYDAYVLYSRRDEDLTSRVIADNLERDGLALCLHHRDLHSSGGESIRGAADASRRLMIVVSHDFLQTEWSRTDFRCALQSTLEDVNPCNRRQKIILLLTASAEAVATDPVMEILLRTCTVIYWGEKRFWNKLRYSLPDPAGYRSTAGKQQGKNKPPDVRRSPNLRYTAAPTSLDSWYKGVVGVPLEDEASSLSTASTLPQYEMPVSGAQSTGGYSCIDGVTGGAHVYSTIPEAPSQTAPRTYFV